MNCIKCGREIPEGELFCAECSRGPAREETHTAHAKATPQKKPVKPANKPVSPKSSRPGSLIAALVLVSLVAVAACGYILWTHAGLQAREASLRVKEADLKLRETEISDLETQLSETSTQLENAQSQIADLEDQIATLESTITGKDSAMNQNQYDMDVQQQEMDQLTQENEELAAMVETLTQENDTQKSSISSMQSELDGLRTINENNQEKLNFIDRYVVFVENDGTNYYHHYECSGFKKQSFWAYSKTLAETRGYTPCPDCFG